MGLPWCLRPLAVYYYQWNNELTILLRYFTGKHEVVCHTVAAHTGMGAETGQQPIF